MFLMTAKVKIGDFKPISPSSLTWKRNIDDYSDSAIIKVPGIAKLKTSGARYTFVESALQFTEGMKIQINAGYNNKNDLRFLGFIKRINYTIPVEIECEGYAYQLRQKMGIKKSWPSNTSLKKILNFLIEGTDIRLSKLIPDLTIESPVILNNASGTQALDLLKKDMLLTVYFNYDELYVGLRETEIKSNVKFQLGWNVVKDDELKFSVNKELAKVNIVLQQREPTGQYKKTGVDSKFDDTKTKRIRTKLPDDFLEKLKADLQKTLINKGYEGMITAFLVPYAEPGMAAVITDKKYQERTGNYFIEGVEGSFSTSGGRQKIKIGNSL